MRFLFLGDIVGNPGVELIRKALPQVIAAEKLDLVVDTLRGRLIPNAGTIDQPVFRV